MKNFNINNLRLQVLFIITLMLLVQSVSAQNSFSISSAAFTGFSRSSMAVADIDGDNDQDVIICGIISNVQTTELYKNDGSGNFTKVNGIPFPAIQGDIAFADVDGDNDQDLILVGFSSTSQGIAELYKNDGSGNFTKVNGTPFLADFYNQVAFIDADGDNDQDIIILGSKLLGTSISKLYKNDGSGNFTASTTLLDCNSRDLEVGDIDGDNDLDFYFLGDGNGVTGNFYVNDGTGNFSTSSTPSVTKPYRGDALLIDTDGDNDLDLVQIEDRGSTGTKIELYTNDGSGAFTLVNGTAFSSLISNSSSGTGNHAVAAGDIDNDNDLDLIFGNEILTGAYINGGGNNFYLENNISLTNEFTDAIFFDANGDNNVDLITSGNHTTKLYNNTFVSANSQKSLDFDGTNIYTAPHNAALNTLPMTIEFWMKTTVGTEGLLEKITTNNGLQIFVNGGNIVSIYQPSVGNSTEINQIGFVVTDGNWHHVAIVIDNSGSTLYQDGVLQGTSAWTGTPAAISNTEVLSLGKATNTIIKYTGSLDEVRFWNATRTATEIRQNMYKSITNPGLNTNLVAYYTMNDYINTYLIDNSSYGNSLTVSAGNIIHDTELINYKAAATNVNSSVQNTTATVGKLTFDDATANGNDPFDAATEIIVAEVTGAPNVTTGITEPNTDEKYYIIQLYNGAGTYSVDLSISSPFPNGSAVSLYRRDDHSTGAWTLLSSGTVVGGKAVFNNISSFSQLMMASSAALPVELLSFTASAKNESIQLDWAVGIEDNLSHYEIERSTNGRDFKNIGSISAKEMSFYDFEDYDVYKNETYYYRLKAIDLPAGQAGLDESFEYSSIVHATMKQLNNPTINIFPNPVTDGIVNINIEGENAYISLHDQTGRMIRNYQPIENSFQINISDLPNGMYYATIMMDGLHTVKKFIKQ